MADDARNEILIERNLLIPMKDGTSLSADLYRPAGGGKFPALMSFYPYHKDDMIGASFEASRRYFAQRGYAHLLIDFRGLGGSDGIAWEAMHRNEGVDGAEACEWIARQSWCDGNVGMWGLVVWRNQLAESRSRKSAASESDRAHSGLREYLCRLHRARRMPQPARLIWRMGFVYARDEPDAADQHRSRRPLVPRVDGSPRKERSLCASVVRASRLRRVLEHQGGRPREDYHPDLHHRRMARHFSRRHARRSIRISRARRNC